MKSWNEIRKDATKFAHRWKGAYPHKHSATDAERVALLFRLYAAKVMDKG